MTSCHWLPVNKFEWKIKPLFELGTWNSKPRQFFPLIGLLTYKIRHSLAELVDKSRKEIIKTVIKIIKIISSFLVVCRKLGYAFFVGVL